MLPKISLEQWQTLKTVVDEGSFTAAALVLNKSQSSVSYAIAKLEEQLPTPALRIEGRKAVLTDAGKVLYRRATQLLDMASELEQVADCLAKGWETEITLNMDTIVPLKPVLLAIEMFAQDAPQTRITILETSLSGTTETILERRADVVITPSLPPGFFSTRLTDVTMIPVAHVNHELNRSKQPVTEQDLKLHRQIVVRDSGMKRQQDTGWLHAEQRLTVTNFAQTVQALRYGLGFAFIPQHMVIELIEKGELKMINLPQGEKRIIPLYLATISTQSEGPAVKAFNSLLVKTFQAQIK